MLSSALETISRSFTIALSTGTYRHDSFIVPGYLGNISGTQAALQASLQCATSSCLYFFLPPASPIIQPCRWLTVPSGGSPDWCTSAFLILKAINFRANHMKVAHLTYQFQLVDAWISTLYPLLLAAATWVFLPPSASPRKIEVRMALCCLQASCNRCMGIILRMTDNFNNNNNKWGTHMPSQHRTPGSQGAEGRSYLPLGLQLTGQLSRFTFLK